MIALSAFMLLTSSQSIAATRAQKPVVCEETTIVMDNIKKSEYKEVPYWVGTSRSEKSAFLIVANKETGTWTLLQVIEGGATCIIGTGEQVKLQD